MRHSKSSSLREKLKRYLGLQGEHFTKARWRSFKKLYNSTPRKLRNQF